MWKLIFVLALSGQLVWGQQGTRVSLINQARDFDFSTASRVRPFPIGTQLPATCVVGETYFRTDVAAGQNLFACVSANVWSPQGYTTVLDPGFVVTRTANNTLSIGGDCSSVRPCLVRLGSQVRSFTQPATLTVSGNGLGTVYIYVSAQGDITIGATPQSTLSLNCTNCTVGTTISDFPVDSMPLFQWSVTSAGVWEPNGIDRRAVLSAGRRFLAGSNITVTEAGANVTISSNNFLPNNAVINGGSLRLGAPLPASPTEPLLGLGAALVGGSASGTAFGIHAGPGFTGDFVNWMRDGVSVIRWGADGSQAAQASGQTIQWTGNSATTANSSFRLLIGGTGSTNAFRLGAGSRDYFAADGTGSVAVGRTAAVPGTADLLVQDATVTTGSTQVQVQAGAGQNRDLLQVLDNGGTVLTRITEQGALRMMPSGAAPACDVNQRGLIWFTASAATVADRIEVCVKLANDSYAWVALF